MSTTQPGINRYVKRSMASIVVGMLLIASAAPAFASSGDLYDPSILIAEGELTNSVHNPATDGTFVAWQFGASSPSTTCHTLYATAFDGLIPAVAQTILKGSNWAISDGLLVWTNQAVNCQQYQAEFNPGIFGVDLLTGEDLIVTTERARWVAIDGRRVMWYSQDPDAAYDYGPGEIRLGDLEGAEAPRTVATIPKGVIALDLSVRGTDLFWIERPGDGSEMRIVKSQVQPEAKPATVLTDNWISWYDIHGDTVFWIGDGVLKTLDTRTLEIRTIAEHAITAAIDGHYLFWTVSNHPEVPLRWAWYGYDLQTDSLFVVREQIGQIGPDYDFVTFVHPGVHGGLVVWTRIIHTDARTEIRGVRIMNLLPTAPLPPGMEDAKQTYYPETGHYLGWGFRDYWTTNGGLPVFGYPLTEEFIERSIDTGQNYAVQFTERQRFEWHPDNAGTPYEVLLGRLGSELLTLQGRDWTTFPKADPASPHYFAESGHAIAPEFWSYWSSHGLEFGDPGVTFRESLALFGYPLSQPMVETNADGDTVLTQYFERAVFEHHPQNAAPYDVLLRRLGAEMLVEREW